MIRTARTVSRRALVAVATLAVVPASLALASAPASAASLKVVDATGDVKTFDEDPESDTFWKAAPEQRDGDVKNVVFTHAAKRVTITARFVELEPTGQFALAARLRDQNGKKHQLLVESTRRNRDGRAELAKYNSEETIACNVTHKIDFERNLVRVGFPRTCIGNPRTLEFTAANYRQVNRKFFIDNPHNTRPNVNVWTAKVRQG